MGERQVGLTGFPVGASCWDEVGPPGDSSEGPISPAMFNEAANRIRVRKRAEL